MYRKNLLLTGIISFSLLLVIWSSKSLPQTRGTRSKDPFEIYQKKSVRIGSVYTKEYLSLARWCKTQKLFEQAEENFELVLEYDPENKQAQKQLEKGFPEDIPEPENMEQLLKQYEQKSHALYKKLASKHTNLGIWCRKNKLFAEAEHEFNRAIKLCDDHKNARKAREELIAQYKVEGLGWFDKKTAAKLRKGLREYKGKWLPKEEVEELRSKWEDAWEIKTRHYLIRTNNTYEQGYEIVQVVEDVYQMYFSIMGKILKLKKPKGLMSIYYFKSEGEYKTKFQQDIGQLPTRGERFGIYVPRIVYCWGPEKKISGRDEKDLARHECTHQLNDLAADARLDLWLEEGVAVYFESVRRDKNGRLTIADIRNQWYEWTAKGRLGGFRAVVEVQEVIELKRFLQFRLKEMKNIKWSYQQAAALMRFFLKSKPGRKYRNRFLKYVQMCYNAPISPKTGLREIDSLKAFKKCFPNINLDELEKQFLAGWDK